MIHDLHDIIRMVLTNNNLSFHSKIHLLLSKMHINSPFYFCCRTKQRFDIFACAVSSQNICVLSNSSLCLKITVKKQVNF